ncbi:NAD(H) kinase 3 [Actinidia rufa]|uniref:NAD(H) kinase 3 n=1 Tax=Actinidia rufa TaxID=165716 RepID=A0A7J0DSH5_9ERIC|nr:NAD(H) kinase 3 [Actinidia rufa]
MQAPACARSRSTSPPEWWVPLLECPPLWDIALGFSPEQWNRQPKRPCPRTYYPLLLVTTRAGTKKKKFVFISPFSSISKDGQPCSDLVNCRSSSLRVSTAAGSTAAMLSAGGFGISILSKDLQYLTREPILLGAANSSLMHGVVKSDESMENVWYCKERLIYVDGAHVVYSIQHGDTIELSSSATVLKVFLPNPLLS